MTHVVIIGGSGHVGTYLVPRLVEAGYTVTNVSRGHRQPYTPHAAWNAVRPVTIDRAAAEADGTFGSQIRDLRPDIVVDMVCFTLPSAQQLIEALRGHVQLFLHCGTVWTHGPSVQVPTTEDQPRRPFGDYGIRKLAIANYLMDQARRLGFPATVLHPGHIVGPGWNPLNPEGHFNPVVFNRLAQGQEILIPNLGLETVHHVHADDVAQIFIQAIRNWHSAVGEEFHTVSPAAVTLRGYAETVASWFGREANVRYLPWDEWKAAHTADEARSTWDHIAHSPNCSIAKAQRLLGYQPRYTSFQAVYEAVQWLIAQGTVSAG